MKNYGDLGGCYPPRPTASRDNTLLDLHNSSLDTQPHSLIVNYCIRVQLTVGAETRHYNTCKITFNIHVVTASVFLLKLIFTQILI